MANDLDIDVAVDSVVTNLYALNQPIEAEFINHTFRPFAKTMAKMNDRSIPTEDVIPALGVLIATMVSEMVCHMVPTSQPDRAVELTGIVLAEVTTKAAENIRHNYNFETAQVYHG